MIVLISSETDLSHTLEDYMPRNIMLEQCATATEALAHVEAYTYTRRRPRLLVLHVTDTAQGVGMCRQLQRAAKLPIIALLNDPAARQPLLEAGAVDYLLLPLAPTEVEARMGVYLRSPSAIFKGLNTVIEHLQRGATLLPETWKRDLVNLARVLGANAAWVLVSSRLTEPTTLVAGYNLPPKLSDDKTQFEQQAEAIFQRLDSIQDTMPLVFNPADSFWEDYLDVSRVPHQLVVPLHSGRRLVGLLTLAYTHPPRVSQFEKLTLGILGQNLSTLMEMKHIQEEIQLYATQNAFIVLIARTISERLDLDSILALTLDQIVPLLNAVGGEIWLSGSDEGVLHLASSLTPPSSRRPSSGRTRGRGLIGWVFEHGKVLHTHTPTEDSRFDPTVDHLNPDTQQTLLAVPLRHRDKTIGVLVIYGRRGTPFANRDIMQLEGIASLTASAIANARLLKELQENAEQRRILYEMSQHIATGLDLETTLDRTLYWIGHLFGVEIVLLWLVREQEEQKQLILSAVKGTTMPAETITIGMGEGLVGWVAEQDEPIVVNDPAEEERLRLDVGARLNIQPRNIIAAPMTYHGESLGVVSLVNKTNASFDDSDLTLFLTMLEMIAIAVGNARLHTQTVTLMQERERLHKQVIQSERMATVGRLTGSLSHEINNPMQAIHGALTLALEELDDPEELSVYINMSLHEAERVVKLVNRMRQIYQPKGDVREPLDLNSLLHEATLLARKELRRKKIEVKTELDPALPRLTAVASQLHLLFLSLLLNLSDAIHAAGGTELCIRSTQVAGGVRVEFTTNTLIGSDADWVNAFRAGPSRGMAEVSFGLSLSRDVVAAHQGSIDLTQAEGETTCSIDLPLIENTENIVSQA